MDVKGWDSGNTVHFKSIIIFISLIEMFRWECVFITTNHKTIINNFSILLIQVTYVKLPNILSLAHYLRGGNMWLTPSQAHWGKVIVEVPESGVIIQSWLSHSPNEVPLYLTSSSLRDQKSLLTTGYHFISPTNLLESIHPKISSDGSSSFMDI